jgi:hypothetical protein
MRRSDFVASGRHILKTNEHGADKFEQEDRGSVLECASPLALWQV